MKSNKPKYQEGGEQEVFQAIAQMLQQMQPEDVVKTLMENNMSQEQAVQAVQQVMQMMQEQQQSSQQQTSPNPEEMSAEQMAYGGVAKLIKKEYGGNVNFDNTSSKTYANDNLAYFANALKKNNALAFLKENVSINNQGLPKAELGLEVALTDLGFTKDQYDNNPQVKTDVDRYLTQINRTSNNTPVVKQTNTTTYNPGTPGVWDGTKFVPMQVNPYGVNPYYGQPQVLQNPNPIMQLFSTMNRQPRVQGFNLPQGFDTQGFLNTVMGTNGLGVGATGKVGDQTYRVTGVTPFNEKKGILGLRRKRGVRFDIDWSDPEQVQEVINDPNVKADFTGMTEEEKRFIEQNAEYQRQLNNPIQTVSETPEPYIPVPFTTPQEPISLTEKMQIKLDMNKQMQDDKDRSVIDTNFEEDYKKMMNPVQTNLLINPTSTPAPNTSVKDPFIITSSSIPTESKGTTGMNNEVETLYQRGLINNKYGGIVKAESGLEVTDRLAFNATPEQWANAGIYSADMLANFAEKVRMMQNEREMNALRRDTVNLYGSKGFDTMEQGLYDQFGNFKPNDLNNQVLNPTSVDYNRLMRSFQEGGEVELSDAEIAQLEAAGYKIKRM